MKAVEQVIVFVFDHVHTPSPFFDNPLYLLRVQMHVRHNDAFMSNHANTYNLRIVCDHQTCMGFSKAIHV